MTNKEIIDWCNEQIIENNFFSFPEEIFENLTEGNTNAIVEFFGSSYLMKMPQSEIDFFEWLKINDNAVWNDLWVANEEPYLVAINFLPLMKSKIRGFPICDLLNNENFYFTDSHLISSEAKLLVETVQKMYREHKQLTVEQALVLEISIEPIDIWRFSYRYNIALERAKKAVDNLIEDNILVHMKDAEYLSDFVKL